MVWAVGKARCRWPRHLGTIKAGCRDLEEHLSYCGIGSVEEKG